MIKYLILIVAVIGIISEAYFLGNKAGKDSVKVECQATVVTQQTEIINENKNVQIRKQINKSVSINDDIEWLRQNRCANCSNKK